MSDQQLINALLFMYTESSLHAGTGSSVSAVDLPIQRERATQFPLVQGSGVKGALRSQAQSRLESLDDSQLHSIGIERRDDIEDFIDRIFGGEEPDPDDVKKKRLFAGAVSVGDARIVLFPVRALKGVFAYATCPAALARLARLRSDFPAIPVLESRSALITKQSDLVASGRIVLEEFTFAPKPDAAADAIAAWLATNAFPDGDAYAYWRGKIMTSLVILPDDDFRDFTVSSTEIATRVRLDRATKTVDGSGLWTQESLPSDTLLVSPIMFQNARKTGDGRGSSEIKSVVSKIVKDGLKERIQLGGDETTGQGMVALRWA
ncbi:MAG: type III-B CRISPR module RAMP protein Cmr4 [Chloroflexota bacterium]|nr:MAG: type III-B CRISPR module RAMP protein Cmr4 [Chloroflexota bacterium]